MTTAAFWILTVLTLLSAATVLLSRSTVLAALALAFNLVSIAGFFFLLSAQFIAVLQVIVYAGAIMVLILFVIMLLNVEDERSIRSSGVFQRFGAPLLGLVFVGLVVVVLAGSSAGTSFPAPSAGFGTVATLGRVLYTRYFYPFEAISLLLIVAMIGAVLLAKRRL